jgi:chorismate synthase
MLYGCKGLGNPVFDKLEAELAKAMLSLPATKVSSCYMLLCYLCNTLGVAAPRAGQPCFRQAGSRTGHAQPASNKGENITHIITCGIVIYHNVYCPKGLGNPVFDKLEAELAKAMLSLPATKVSCYVT